MITAKQLTQQLERFDEETVFELELLWLHLFDRNEIREKMPEVCLIDVSNRRAFIDLRATVTLDELCRADGPEHRK